MNQHHPSVVVIGPGGIKGLIQLGALSYIEQKRIFSNTQIYCGVSVGAVTCLMITSGYTINEIIIESMKISHLFQDLSSISFTNIRKNIGLLDQKIFKEKLKIPIEKKFGFVPTLKQLYMMTGKKFMVVTYNCDIEKEVYISYESDPDLLCIDAVLLSMNIPFVFYKLKYKEETYIDGAFGNPYPVDIFDDGKTDILGIYITTKANPKDTENSIFLYIYKIIVCAMQQLRNKIEKASSSRVKHLELICPVNDFTGITMSIEAKADLILRGYETAKKFYED